jgi:hypothetical protein
MVSNYSLCSFLASDCKQADTLQLKKVFSDSLRSHMYKYRTLTARSLLSGFLHYFTVSSVKIKSQNDAGENASAIIKFMLADLNFTGTNNKC